VTVDPPLVRNVSRCPHERPGPPPGELIADPERHLPAEHVERLVLATVDVEWGRRASRDERLPQGECAAGVLREGLEEV
jgi:hypothetical protein